MDRLSSIIVGVDFSPASAAALAQGLRFAEWNRSSLHVVHVINTLVAVELQEALSPMVQQIQDALIADARQAWQAFAPEVGDKSNIDFAVAVNNELVEILRRVNERKADLLILGVRGHSSGRGAGVLASQAVRRATCKVLLVREGQPGPFKNVVVGIDFSATSRLALQAALRITAQDGGVLRIVHVARPPWTRFHYRAPTLATSPEFQHQYLEAYRRRLEDFCRQANPEIDWAKPEFQIIENNSHGEGLTGYVHGVGADLVVLGTRGHTNLRDMLIGSTAERVVRDAPCAILAIKPGE